MLHHLTAIQLAQKVRDREVGCVELLEYFLDRCRRYNDSINAIIVWNTEAARIRAEAADVALEKGEIWGPLHGVPMTIKEAYDIEGLPTTWGFPELEHNIATADSETVVRMKHAGAHFFGKTNVPLSLADFQSFNDIYGTTNNPWNLERTPGGSSGGSAAALAAGLTGLEAGSDIGGSIRNPAHFCGIYGHKPTWGVVSDAGHALPGQVAPADIAVVGPMARSAEDLKVSMDVSAGAASHDSAGWQLMLPKPSKNNLKDFRVSIWTNDDMAPVSQEISDRVQLIGEILSRLGATVSDSARPEINLEESHETYSSLLWGVMAAELSAEEKSEYQAGLGQLDPNDRSIAANMIRYSVQAHGTWAENNNKRFLIRQKWQSFFNDWDIVICPQTATTAFPQDQGEYLERELMVDNVAQDYFQQVFWSGLVTVAHLPSTVFPTGLSQEGLPIGLQAVGAEFNDYITIDFTRLMAQEIGGFIPPPAYA